MKKGLSLPLLPASARVGPGRWEIAVFKLPEEPEVRYIKRQVGLPGETIRIDRGDLWRSPGQGSEPFERLRRPFAHQQVMQVLVYDDARRAASLQDDARWRRRAPVSEGWSEPVPGQYLCSSTTEAWSELRYRHLVTDPEQWQAIRNGEPLPVPPRPTLITDFSSYNTDLTAEGLRHPRAASRPWFQPHWVGDLTLSCELDVQQSSGLLRLELFKGEQSSRCEIDLATGSATLYRGGNQLGEPAATRLGDRGKHTVVFANVDDRLTLLADGTLPFGDGRDYNSPAGVGFSGPAAADLRAGSDRGQGGQTGRLGAGTETRRLLHALSGRSGFCRARRHLPLKFPGLLRPAFRPGLVRCAWDAPARVSPDRRALPDAGRQ